MGGNVGINTRTASERLDVVGNAKFSGSVQIGDNAVTASETYKGVTRYYEEANRSVWERCSKVGASLWAWQIVEENIW
jgi:hypothetical protein